MLWLCVVSEAYLWCLNLSTQRKVFRVNSDLNIYFATETSCPQSTVLSVDHYDPPSQLWFVTTGGVLGNPSSDTLSYWFKIEKYEKLINLFSAQVCAPTAVINAGT
uniref:Uncharacterized protein n=1 Tax=Lotus japonicus TaxID=34305 RepID=I3SD76_LOTJA|nr:unknown [Lotus japonicus]